MDPFIDLRSDTVTQPSQAMREAIFRAEVGDDIMGEDPTVRRLESLSAEMLGKEAAIFVTSGTMGNQLAVMAMARRGEEVIIGDTSHIYNLEAGGMAALSQVQTRPIAIPDGIYDPVALRGLIQEEGLQQARTSLICLENTNNLNAGLVVPQSNLNEIYALAKERGIYVHLDGARIFNASVQSGLPVAEICRGADTVMFALTKGLAAPFGAILAGPKKIIDQTRWLKQRIGGGFRQAGFMAAAGIVALQAPGDQISQDQVNARYLGEALSKIPGIRVKTDRVHTNIVVASLAGLACTVDEFTAALLERRVKVKRISDDSVRLVTHYGIEPVHLDTVIEAFKAVSSTNFSDLKLLCEEVN